MAKTEPMRNTYTPHERVTLNFTKPSRTKQEFKDECNVNKIIERFTKTGVLPNANNKTPQYLDLTVLGDLQQNMEIMIAANTAFMSLPSNVRREFDNNPVAWAEFASQPENLEKMREWGLAPPEATPEPPQRVQVVNPEPPTTPEPARDG